MSDEKHTKRGEEQDGPPDSVYVNQFQNARGKAEQAFSELYNRYEQEVLWYLMKLTQNKTLATDLKQETFLKALRGLDGFKQKSSFKTWLFRIATNTWRNYIKKNRPVSGVVDDEEKVTNEMPDQIAAKHEREEQVCQAIEEIPEKLRVALVLVRFEDMTYKEAAETLDIGLSAVKMRVSRATRKLTNMLTDER